MVAEGRDDGALCQAPTGTEAGTDWSTEQGTDWSTDWVFGSSPELRSKWARPGRLKPSCLSQVG